MKRGFTLIEMLVAVGLTVLMMSLFTEIFYIATNAMSKQKGVTENDQRARTMNTLLRGDIQKRTFREVMPFDPTETPAAAANNYALRRGYLEISENDPNNDTDDVVQLTVEVDTANAATNLDTNPLYGHATLLTTTIGPNLGDNPNQPETDGGNVVPDSTAQSNLAEISYFLRSGKLYRRVMLIRQPLQSGWSDEPSPGNPPVAGSLFDPTNAANIYPTLGRSFWNDFDFSAYYNLYAQFNGASSLNYNAAAPIGFPWFRWGHSPTTGNPRELTNGLGTGSFIGRFTHEETSNSAFLYPQQIPAGDPMELTTVLDPLTASGAVSTFASGPRQGEDVLMSNVHAFDVKLWDESLGQFMDIGHNATGGDFYQTQANLHVVGSIPYGPQPTLGVSRQFDTWSPNFPVPNSPNNPTPPYLVPDLPPFKPLRYYPSTLYAAPYTLGSVWTPLGGPYTTYLPGPPAVAASAVYPTIVNGWIYAYVCTAAVGSATSGATEPTWNTTPGGLTVDGNVTWTTVSNWKPVRAIQITVRFLDIPSNQMRTLTIVESLIDP